MNPGDPCDVLMSGGWWEPAAFSGWEADGAVAVVFLDVTRERMTVGRTNVRPRRRPVEDLEAWLLRTGLDLHVKHAGPGWVVQMERTAPRHVVFEGIGVSVEAAINAAMWAAERCGGDL
jgi:hypothetical protein